MAHRVAMSSLRNPLIKALFYGQPGSGKTRTVATAAQDERLAPVLMLEQGGNPISIRSYTRAPDIVHMDGLAEFNPIYEWLAKGQPADHTVAEKLELNPPYRTLVIDSITEVQRMSFGTVVGTTGTGPGSIPSTAEIQHFNKVLAQMVTFARLFFSLPMNVILTSLERDDKDETTGTIMHKPLLWGQSSGEVSGYAYLVARLVHRARLDNKTKMAVDKAVELKIVEDPITDTTVSVALFQPSGKYIAKDQYGALGPFMADPTMTKILDKILASMAGTQLPTNQPTERKN